MADHFCQEHNVAFLHTKRGNYAHPIEGKFKDGKQVWCNEEKTEQAKTTETSPVVKESKPPRDNETNNSIEAQVSFKGVIELLANKVIDLNHSLALTALNYAMSKLGRWSSVGDTGINPPVIDKVGVKDGVPEKLVTPEQIAEIKATAKAKGYDAQTAVAIMTRLWHKSSSKALTTREANEFIAVMEQGKYLEEIDPNKIPF